MTNTDILSKILQWEGGFTDDPLDRGGATKYGITAATLSHWRGRPVRTDEVKALTKDEALQIYEKLYIKDPGFDPIPMPLKVHLIDFGINSGPAVAIRTLQDCLNVTADGVLGPETLGALKLQDPFVINNNLAKSRTMMIGRIVTRDPSQVKFLTGWLRRALSYLV